MSLSVKNMPWAAMVLPRHMQEAVNLVGTKETPGTASNPVILGWAKELGMANIYKADSTPWCGLFMAIIMKRAGRPTLASWDNLRARSWANWGVPVNKAALGDVLVFSRSGGGHVGLYAGEDNYYYYVLGGNQGDMVNITRIAKGRCIAINRPAYNNQPASVQPFVITGGAAPISTNEA